MNLITRAFLFAVLEHQGKHPFRQEPMGTAILELEG